MLISYKFRIYPSKTTETRLNEQLELCRCLYNKLLEEVNKARKEGRKINWKYTQALIVKLKQERPELKNVYSKVLQMVNYQLWSNIKALNELRGKGKKVVRYKTSLNSFKTMNFNQSGFKIERKRLILSKVGEIPIKLHRPIDGRIRGIIVKRTKTGKWFAIVQAEVDEEPLPKTGRVVALDLGIHHFCVDSDGIARIRSSSTERLRKSRKFKKSCRGSGRDQEKERKSGLSLQNSTRN